MITNQSNYYDFDLQNKQWVYRYKGSSNWYPIKNNDLTLKLTKLAATIPEYRNNPTILDYVTHQKNIENWMQLLPEQKQYRLGEEILKQAQCGKLAESKKEVPSKKEQSTITFVSPKSPQEWAYSLVPRDKKATEIVIPVETTDTIPYHNIEKFAYDTVMTPGVRNVTDPSYKDGHGLTNQQKAIVLHHTGTDYQSSLNWLTDARRKASAHVIIKKNGDVTVLARPDQVTFHAGRSSWKGVEDVNDYAIGIEFEGDTNEQDLTEAQIQSAVQYMIPIIEANNIPADMIVSHAMISKEYGDRHPGKGTGKVDINEANYNKVMAALNEQYYNKVAQHQQGGAVGTNRTYAQTVKENLQSLYEKLKSNTFINLLFPLEEVANGNTLAVTPYLIPAGGAVKTTAKLLTGKQPMRISSGKPRIKKLSPQEIQAFVDEAEEVGRAAKQPGLVVKIGDEIPAETIQQNYEKAMIRRRDYTYPYVGENANGSYGIIGKDNESMLLSLPTKQWQPGQLIFFSHFAPASIRSGYELLKDVVNSPDPLGLAVTNDLAPMLDKIGMKHITETLQPFNGELTTKQVYVNPATKFENVEKAPEWNWIQYWLEPGELQKIKKALLNVGSNYQVTPNQNALAVLSNPKLGNSKVYPKETNQLITNSVVPRMAAARGEDITDMATEVRQTMGIGYQEHPASTFDGYGKNATGLYSPSTNSIAIRQGYAKQALPHEIRHKIDYGIPLTNEEYNYLEKAYGKAFNFANQQAASPTNEWVTTNFDARRKLLGDNALQYLPVKVQNQKIDAMSANQIIDALKTANGYGERFVKALGESAYDPKQIKALKNAMKYVGAAATPVGLNYFDIMNNNGRTNNQNPQ